MKVGVWLMVCAVAAGAVVTEPAAVVFDRAVQALTAGDYAAAEQGFKTVLRQEPNNVGALGDLGILYARTNRAHEAIAAYERALRLSPNDEPILLNLGLVHLKSEAHASAEPYFARVLAIDGKNEQAAQLLAVCRIYTGKTGLAIRALDELRAAHPGDVQILFLLAFAHLKQGDAELAQQTFKEMFAVAPPAQAQFLLGQASYEAALFPQAEESFLVVQKLDADYAGLHLALGKLYISERRTEDAVRELSLALKERAGDEDATYFLGSLLVQEGRWAEGIPYLERAKELRPDSWAVYFYLGKAKLRMGEIADAVRMLQHAVRLSPEEGPAEYQLGRALEAQGDKVGAAKAFRKAKELRADELKSVKIPGVQ